MSDTVPSIYHRLPTRWGRPVRTVLLASARRGAMRLRHRVTAIAFALLLLRLSEPGALAEPGGPSSPQGATAAADPSGSGDRTAAREAHLRGLAARDKNDWDLAY